VVVGDGHRLRIEIEVARDERADDEVRALERLMRRRRLMNATCDRLEVMNRERPGVEEAVPPDEVELTGKYSSIMMGVRRELPGGEEES
jgi:hypothetical protein